MRARADFQRLWAGQTISELGSQVTLVALPLTAILVLHASAFAVALLTTFEYLPFLVFGVLAGVWVDRLRYRHVLIFTDVARSAVLGSIPVADAFGVLSIAQLYVVAFVTGSLTVFFSVAYHAYLPTLVERELLVLGNTRLETTRSIAQTAGPAAGGGLVSLLSAPIAVAADAMSFGISALLLVAIRTKDAPTPEVSARRLRAELREGVAFLWRQPILRANLFSSVSRTSASESSGRSSSSTRCASSVSARRRSGWSWRWDKRWGSRAPWPRRGSRAGSGSGRR